MLSIPAGKIMDYDFGTYKGFYVENFVAQELLACSENPRNPMEIQSWAEGRAEIEFVMETNEEIIPIEVKSGQRARSRSLQSYKQRYNPHTSVILSARMPAVVVHDRVRHVNLPHYYAGVLSKL
jgi:uncharacterized protein